MKSADESKSNPDEDIEWFRVKLPVDGESLKEFTVGFPVSIVERILNVPVDEAIAIRKSVADAVRDLREKRRSHIADSCFAESYRLEGLMRENSGNGTRWQKEKSICDAVKKVALEISGIEDWKSVPQLKRMLVQGLRLAVNDMDTDFFVKFGFKLRKPAPGFVRSQDARANPLESLLLRQWILPGNTPSFCYFTYPAIVEYLNSNPLGAKSFTVETVSRCCQRLKLRRLPAALVTHVNLTDGKIILRGDKSP